MQYFKPRNVKTNSIFFAAAQHLLFVFYSLAVVDWMLLLLDALLPQETQRSIIQRSESDCCL